MQPSIHTDQCKVVLVAPRNPLNIGAAARAMANFGFRRLAVVTPYAPSWRDARSAVGAPELLTEAHEFPTLEEAIADCTLVLGTGTLTYRKPEQPVIPLPALTAHPIWKNSTASARPAIVFGSEKHGLSRDDLSWCHGMIEIPTDPRQPSMNLGQAVAVCLYQLSLPPAVDSAPTPAPLAAATPTAERLDRLATLIEETLALAEYSPQGMRAANQHDLRLLLRRLNLSEPDLRRLLGAFRRIFWRLTHGPRLVKDDQTAHKSR